MRRLGSLGKMSAHWSAATAAATLLATLSSPDTRDTFEKYLRSEYAEDSLLFYADVEAFERGGDPVDMDEARRIRDLYVAPSGERAINISASMRKAIERCFAVSAAAAVLTEDNTAEEKEPSTTTTVPTPAGGETGAGAEQVVSLLLGLASLETAPPEQAVHAAAEEDASAVSDSPQSKDGDVWTEVCDPPTGHVYWYNTVTGESAWAKPTTAPPEPESASVPTQPAATTTDTKDTTQGQDTTGARGGGSNEDKGKDADEDPGVTSTVFAVAQGEVFTLMAMDNHKRFLQRRAKTAALTSPTVCAPRDDTGSFMSFLALGKKKGNGESSKGGLTDSPPRRKKLNGESTGGQPASRRPTSMRARLKSRSSCDSALPSHLVEEARALRGASLPGDEIFSNPILRASDVEEAVDRFESAGGRGSRQSSIDSTTSTASGTSPSMHGGDEGEPGSPPGKGGPKKRRKSIAGAMAGAMAGLMRRRGSSAWKSKRRGSQTPTINEAEEDSFGGGDNRTAPRPASTPPGGLNIDVTRRSSLSGLNIAGSFGRGGSGRRFSLDPRCTTPTIDEVGGEGWGNSNLDGDVRSDTGSWEVSNPLSSPLSGPPSDTGSAGDGATMTLKTSPIGNSPHHTRRQSSDSVPSALKRVGPMVSTNMALSSVPSTFSTSPIGTPISPRSSDSGFSMVSARRSTKAQSRLHNRRCSAPDALTMSSFDKANNKEYVVFYPKSGVGVGGNRFPVDQRVVV